ncbi:MAG TPA: HEAT repeat domain-containing protein [Pyrinomonadaceae bacterium]|nr:HEAT repeat domain-containing protein [Pyrinomonadaceae bacterium]
MRRTGAGGTGRIFNYSIILFFLSFFAASSYAQNLESLEQTIRSGDAEQKRSALHEIKNVATEQASRIAVPALGDKDTVVRATAASAVIHLPTAEAAQVLLPLLGDKQEFVRREAALALGEVGSRSATSALLRTAQSDKVVEVRDAAVVALGQIGDSSSLSALTAILRSKPKDDSEFLRRSAARAIGQVARFEQFGSTRTVTPENFLPAKYKDKNNPDFKDLTVAGPGSSQTSESFLQALSVLITVLNSSSESYDTRREAAFALGMIGSASAKSVLTKFATDSDPYLAEICKEALIKLP